MRIAADEESVASMHHFGRFTRRLCDPNFRRRIYLACAILMYLMALGLMTAKALFSQKERSRRSDKDRPLFEYADRKNAPP